MAGKKKTKRLSDRKITPKQEAAACGALKAPQNREGAHRALYDIKK